jgi:hypothetical protein
MSGPGYPAAGVTRLNVVKESSLLVLLCVWLSFLLILSFLVVDCQGEGTTFGPPEDVTDDPVMLLRDCRPFKSIAHSYQSITESINH